MKLIRFKPKDNHERNAIDKFGQWWIIEMEKHSRHGDLMIKSVNQGRVKGVGMEHNGRWISSSQIIEKKDI